MELLKTLCGIHAPSGEEAALSTFLLKYIEENKSGWKVQPVIHKGNEFQDSIVLVFGQPTTAVFAHMDSIGFTVRYGEQLGMIGQPVIEQGVKLRGYDNGKEVFCSLKVEEQKNKLSYTGASGLSRGTSLTYLPDYRETEDFIQCCYMDNRLGVYSALKVAETLENGIICFSCYEEHGGGSAEFLGKFIYETYGVRQALISDITWITDGIKAGQGVVVSMRDSGIPRRSFVNRIIDLAKRSNIPFQLEVEFSGGSDGNSLQRSPYPFDWCFIGAPEDFVHSPNEKVHKKDIKAMIELYSELMKHL